MIPYVRIRHAICRAAANGCVCGKLCGKRVRNRMAEVGESVNRTSELGVSFHSANYCITLYFRGRKISRKVNLKYFREKIFSRIYCSRENIFPRKYLPAKISSRENIIPRKYFPAIVSVPQIQSDSRPRLCGDRGHR